MYKLCLQDGEVCYYLSVKSTHYPSTIGGNAMGSLVVTGVTFAVFMTEGLIHYNMGNRKVGRWVQIADATPQGTCKDSSGNGSVFDCKRTHTQVASYEYPP